MFGRGTFVREEISYRYVRRHLIATEELVFATRVHWIRIIGPVAAAFFGTIAAIVITLLLPPNFRILANVLFVGVVYLWIRLLMRAWIWAHDWFIMTDQRFIRITGYFEPTVRAMPVGKLTDLTYGRTFWGEILGYGKFVFENAGQDQALSEIPFVPESDRLNYELNYQLFGKKGKDDTKHRERDEHHSLVQYWQDFTSVVGAPFRGLIALLSPKPREDEAPELEDEPDQDFDPHAEYDLERERREEPPAGPAAQPADWNLTRGYDDPAGTQPVDPGAYQSRRPRLDARDMTAPPESIIPAQPVATQPSEPLPQRRPESYDLTDPSSWPDDYFGDDPLPDDDTDDRFDRAWE